MRTLLFLLQKEFRQIFRNKSILAMVIMMPLIQLIVLPLAANYEVKNINISIIDHDHSSNSRQLINTITASGYFKLVGYKNSFHEAFEQISLDKADVLLEIPAGFERNLIRENQQQLFVAVNAINGVKANLGGAYVSNIIANYNQTLRAELMQPQKTNPWPVIETTSTNYFNVMMNYNLFMVPGILAILVTMVGGFLTALNIVKEKEVGTIEQINVTPIKKHIFILGKLIPFWVLGNVVFTVGLIVARMIYGIVPAGNLLVMYSFVWVYLLAVLGFGLLISTFTETQQQAMLIMFFFMMIFILTGGLFTPIESMPEWAQTLTRLNPVTYLIQVMRMVVLKGSGFRDNLPQLGSISIFAVILNSWAILNYRKRS